MVVLVFRLLIHLLFLVPLIFGKYFLSLAALLFAVVCYIKAFKWNEEAKFLTRSHGDPTKIREYERQRRRWQNLTFLPSNFFDSERSE